MPTTTPNAPNPGPTTAPTPRNTTPGIPNDLNWNAGSGAPAAAPKATLQRPGLGGWIHDQLAGTGEQDYGQGLGYLIDNPVTRGLGQSANQLATGAADLVQHGVGVVSPTAASWLQRNVTTPLAQRGQQLEAPKSAGLGAAVVQGLSNLGGQLTAAALTGGAAPEAEAAAVAPGVIGKIASHLTPAALRGAGLLGFTQAGAQAAQEEAQTGTPVSTLGLLGRGVAGTAANLVPLGGKGSVLKRTLSGALVGEGVNEAQNLVNGQPLGTGSLMAAGLGAGLGLLPHGAVPHPDAAPGSLSDAANTLHETQAAADATAQAATAAAAPEAPSPTAASTRVDPGLPPWADPDTGEIASPKKPELVSAMADHMLGQYQASGDMRVDVDQIAQAWHVDPALVRNARSAATKMAQDRLAQSERVAMAKGASANATEMSAQPATDTGTAEAPEVAPTAPENRAPGAPLHAWTPIDDSVSVPYAGGVSDDGNTVYLDKRMPTMVNVDGMPVDARQAVALHERTEWPLMHLAGPMDGAALDDLAQRVGLKDASDLPDGVRSDLAAGKSLDYAQAHDLATQAENQFVRTTYGVDPDKYQAALTDAIDTARKQAPAEGDIPTDLDAKPYANEGEAPLAKGLDTNPPEDTDHGTQAQAATAGVPAPPPADERGAAGAATKATEPNPDRGAAAGADAATAGRTEPAGAREAEPARTAEQPPAPQPETAGVASGTNGLKRSKLPEPPMLPGAPFDMTPDQVHAHAEAVNNHGTQLEDAILGDQADAWRKAVRQSESRDAGRAAQGEAAVENIESGLSKEHRDALYGVNGRPESFDDLADYHQAHSDALVQSPAEAGEAMARFLTKLGGTEGRDPSKWSRDAQVAYAGMRTLGERIAQEGWDSKAIQKRAMQQAAARYGDANDAELMLRRFLPAEPTTKTAERKPAPAKQIGQAPRASAPKRIEAAKPAEAAPAAAVAAEGQPSAAARDAEGLRVKTPNGEVNGRVHVDRLVRDGYTRVESTRAGDKMVHSLVNAEGARESIKARQLKYAKEATASAAPAIVKESLTVGQKRTRELLGAGVGDTIRTTGFGKDIQPGNIWKIERIDRDGTVHTSSYGGGFGSFTRGELAREVRAGATFEKVGPPKTIMPEQGQGLVKPPETPPKDGVSASGEPAPAPKRGGIATNGAKVRVAGGKLEYVPRARETLKAYFRPGDVVPSYGGQDRVISTDFSDAANPLVRVIAVDKDGNVKPNEHERVHATMPSARELVTKLGKPELARKDAKTKTSAPADATQKASATGKDETTEATKPPEGVPAEETAKTREPVEVGETEAREDGGVRLFRQGNDGGTRADVRATTPQQAHTAKIKALTDDLTKHWKGDDLPGVKVVDTPEQLPDEAKVNPVTGLPDASYQRARGMYDGKTLWVVASKHDDTPAGREQLARTIVHEGVGHYGVERIVVRELGADAWGKIETATERLRANPETAGPAIRKVLDELGKRYAAADRTTFAKEFLAVSAERGVKNGLLDRAIAAVRSFLRRVMPDMKVNEADLRRLLAKSDEYLQRGETPRERVQARAALAFSRDGWGEGFPNVVTAHQPGFVREHSDYVAAKAGDDKAALRLARDAVTPEFVAKVRNSLPDDVRDPIVVPVQARESAGDNRIPSMAAEVLAEKLGAETDNGIKQAEKVSRGGSDAMHRLANQPTFTGDVQPGRDYVLLDDTLTQGGTLAQLKTHIEREGGRVVLATALTGKDYSRKLALDPETLGKVRERFGRIEGWWQRHFGYGFDGLTESEARTLLTYDKGRLSPDTVRDRILAGKLPELRGVGEGPAGARPGAEASRGTGDAVQPAEDAQRQQDAPGGVAVTDSPEFKQFFGKSKVVDDSGQPVPVYHGTADDFSVFGHDRSGAATGHATSPLGHFFTPDRAQAEGYARNASDGRPADERVVDAYLSIQKPYEMSLKEAQAIATPDEARAVRAKLEAKGYDGIHLLEQNAWVAFDPEQIKSASENRGTFDRENPNIYFDKAANVDDSGQSDSPGERRPFSHAAESIETMREVLPKLDEKPLQRAKEWVKGKVIDLEPHLLGALQLRHVLDIAKDIPELKQGATAYEDKFQAMDADRNKMTVAGAAQVKSLNDWAYEKGLGGWRGKLKPEARKLFQFMHKVTQLGVDPTNAYEKLLMRDPHGDLKPWTQEMRKQRIEVLREQMRGRSGDDKTKMLDQIKELQRLPAREKARAGKYPELVAQWNALTEGAKQHFMALRDHYRAQSDALEEARNDRIEALDLPRQEKSALQQINRDMFAEMRADGVYFPLQRFGDFWIAGTSPEVRNAQGDVVRGGDYTFTKYENAKQAIEAEKQMRAGGYEIESRGRQIKNFDTQKPVTGSFMAEVQDVLRRSKAPDSVRDELNQMFLKTLPELSLRKRGIHRYNVAGYTDNVPRVFASSVLHGAHQISKARYGYQLEDTLQHLKETLEAKRIRMSVAAAAHADALMGELDKRHSWILNPTSNKLVTMMNSIGFTYYLSASPASAMVNFAQTPMITLPVLAAKHGWDKAPQVLAATVKDAIRTGGNLRRVLKTDEERQAFDALEAAGTFQRTATHTLGGVADDNALAMHPAWGKVLGAMGYLFQKAEVINRESAGIAAFRLARADGMSVQAAIKHADDIVNDTHFDYSNANRSRWMQGNVGKVLGQFKSYSVGMTWLYYRNLQKALAGETPEVRALARRTLTGILGMTSLFAGVMGTPINNLLAAGANAYNAAFGNDNEPWNFNTEFEKWLGDHLGTTAASVIAHGAVSQLGADVSHRLSSSDMWFRDTDQNLQGTAAYDAFLESMAGPIGGIARNLFLGTQQMNQGHTERGIETLMPTAIKNAMKGMRYATQGANTINGAPIVSDVSGPEALIQAMGFQPTKVAEQQRTNTALQGAQQFVVQRRQALMNAYAMAYQNGNSDDLGTALGKIRDFNQTWPQYPISMMTLRDSMRTRARDIAQTQGGVRLNKRLDAALRAQTVTERAAQDAGG